MAAPGLAFVGILAHAGSRRAGCPVGPAGPRRRRPVRARGEIGQKLAQFTPAIPSGGRGAEKAPGWPPSPGPPAPRVGPSVLLLLLRWIGNQMGGDFARLRARTIPAASVSNPHHREYKNPQRHVKGWADSRRVVGRKRAPAAAQGSAAVRRRRDGGRWRAPPCGGPDPPAGAPASVRAGAPAPGAGAGWGRRYGTCRRTHRCWSARRRPRRPPASLR